MEKVKIRAIKENGKVKLLPRMMTIVGLDSSKEADVKAYRNLQAGESAEVSVETAEYLICNHFCEYADDEKLFGSGEEDI